MNAVQHESHFKNFVAAWKRIGQAVMDGSIANPNKIKQAPTLIPKIKNGDGTYTWSNKTVSDSKLTLREYVEYRKFAGKYAVSFDELQESGIRQATTNCGTVVWTQKRDLPQEIKIMVKEWFK